MWLGLFNHPTLLNVFIASHSFVKSHTDPKEEVEEGAEEEKPPMAQQRQNARVHTEIAYEEEVKPLQGLFLTR